MRHLRKHWRGIAAAGAIVLVVLVLGCVWVAPLVITSVARSAYGGHVTIGGWWVGFRSAGVTGLRLHEGQETSSPVWLSADTVSTDLSLGSLLHGRFRPRRVMIDDPNILIRLGEDGKVLTQFPGPANKNPPPTDQESTLLPSVEVTDGTITFHQIGRPHMIVNKLEARLLPDKGGFSQLDASSADRDWGRLTARGRFGPDFESVSLTLKTKRLDATPAKAASLPFVPPATWNHVEPTGPLDVSLSLRKPAKGDLSVLTVVSFDQTALDLPSLDLHAEKATGAMKVDATGLVSLEQVRGEAIGGHVEANGTLNFGQSPAQIDLSLALESVDVTRAPESWQLQEAGLTGRLTGKTHLLVALKPSGADLTGSTGDAEISGASLGGIPVKSLKLEMSAEGQDLHYDSGSTSSSASLGHRLMALHLVALQQPATEKTEEKTEPDAKPSTGGLILPKTISTSVEFEDVNVAQIVAKAQGFGVTLPFDVAGKLSLKAKATIPLGTLGDIKSYAFHGSAQLKQAHIAGIDIGHAEAQLDLEDGVLDLSKFQGQLVDRPQGDMLHPAPSTKPIPDQGPLPSGGFRAQVHANLSPAGPISAHLEARDLPLGELAAPYLPKPTPLSGLVDAEISVHGDLARATEPAAWAASGRIASREITFETARLDAVSTTFQVQDARLHLTDLNASLDEKPLKGEGQLALTPPYAYTATLDVSAWDLTHLLALIPSMPRTSPISGAVTAEAKAEGNLSPFRVETSGTGTLADLLATGVPLGNVPFRWSTGAEAIEMNILDAHPFGGTLSADLLLPFDDRELTGSSRFLDLDAHLIDAAYPEIDLGLDGRASGHVIFQFRSNPPEGALPIEIDARLESKHLTIRGVPVHALHGVASLEDSGLKYDLYAEALEGKFQIQGSLPIAAENPAPRPLPKIAAETEPNGRLRAIGFRLDNTIWTALGVGGALDRLDGEGAIDANLHLSPRPFDLRAHGIAEFRNLRLGPSDPLGRLRGEFLIGPNTWEVDKLSGELFGGSAAGSLTYTLPTAQEPSTLNYRVEINSADVDRMAALAPPVKGVLSGRANLRATGRLDDALRAQGDLRVLVGRLYGLPMTEFDAPVQLTYLPTSGNGTVEARRFHVRLAGGRVEGTARIRFGLHRNFTTDLSLSQLDLELLSRSYFDSKRPTTGKVSGTIALHGVDTYRSETYAGRADLALTDASVLDLPVFRALDRFLGGPAGGGVFEQGELHALIANRQIVVEQLALFGRVAQLHGEGTVGFDGQLNLVILVNTNQLIPETGQALIALIPGIRNARGSAATLQVSNYLSNKLLKLRVTGTVRNPVVTVDGSATVSNAAVGFFAGILKLPFGLVK